MLFCNLICAKSFQTKHGLLIFYIPYGKKKKKKKVESANLNTYHCSSGAVVRHDVVVSVLRIVDIVVLLPFSLC